MPASKKDIKKLQQKKNVAAGIGDEKGRLPSQNKVSLLGYTCRQYCGSESGSGSTGSTCLWASWILLSPSRKSKKNLATYCFVTSFWLFIFENNLQLYMFLQKVKQKNFLKD
jgi:hypothetical protein